MWTVEDDPPVDPDSRELAVTLASGGPRWVSPDGAFAIWSASLEDGRTVTLRGGLGHVAAGETVVVAGAVERHERYGWQFSVASFRSALPQTAEGVALWLRRRVPGIGPTFARAIVEHFGAENVFVELDRDPERLREVRTKAGRAISRRAMERAVEAWREVAAIREVEAFLFSHGIGAGLAARLVRTYGTDVIAVLEDDPYRLTEVPRVGFRVADGIARQFPAVVAPWSSEYHVMLSRPLLYTAVTRAQRLCVLAGERRALRTAVAREQGRTRHSSLAERLR